MNKAFPSASHIGEFLEGSSKKFLNSKVKPKVFLLPKLLQEAHHKLWIKSDFSWVSVAHRIKTCVKPYNITEKKKKEKK